MSYIKLELPEYEILKKELTDNPDRILYYIKYEGFGGDFKSVQLLNQKIKEFQKLKVTAGTTPK